MSYVRTATEIYRSGGMRGFYTGLLTTYMKVMPSTAIAFAINEHLKGNRSL